jgi:superfamily II DNA or RNA helicase
MRLNRLRDYQSKILEEFKLARLTHNRIVVACPTGSGKTILAVDGIIPLLSGPIAWVTHRSELAEQIRCHKCPVHVIMAQTREPVHGYKSIIIDEGHHVAANSYQKIIRQNPDALIVCLTATPYRMDGVGLGACGFTKIIVGPDIYELTQMRWLSPAKVFVPASERQGAWEPQAAIQSMLKHKFSRGLVYCHRIKAAQEMAQILSESKIPVGVVTGDMDLQERSKIVAQFARGRIKVLLNHTIFTEGNDIPAIDMVVLNRLTHSRCLWRQTTGRGLRPSPKKTHCIVLDLAGNALLHGSIYDKEIFSLQGSVETTNARECPSEIEKETETEIENLNKGETLKLWTPKPKPVKIIENLQKLRSISLLRRSKTDFIAC